MTATVPPIVEFVDALVRRGSTTVFDGLSLAIPAGQNIAVIGPNGAGKSTLVKLLSRQLFPVRRPGSAMRLAGADRFSVHEYQRRVGIVAEDVFRLFSPVMSAQDAIVSAFTGTAGVIGMREQATPENRAAAHERMDELGIKHLESRPLARLSSGELRRVMIARATVHEPDLLVLDEPHSGLDLGSRIDLDHWLQTAMGQRTSVVLVVHSFEQIPAATQRVIALSEGRIVADGSLNSVINSASMSALYERKITVHELDGSYIARPSRDPVA